MNNRSGFAAQASGRKTAVKKSEKENVNPGLSAILSFLYNGLGQLYNGQIKKGLIIIAVSSFGIFLTIAGATLIGHCLLIDFPSQAELLWGCGLLLTGIGGICYIGIYSIFDAYTTAKNKL
ncbi:MAG: hypothetical protein V1752_08710 [Candidatus Firestonebacteria bacterium]